MKVISERVVERFWAKVDKRLPDECWPWTAHLNSHGYGGFYWHHQCRNINASRMAWMISTGQPDLRGDIHICHTCDNRSCCNPAHLWEGTAAENAHDMFEKGRNCVTRGAKKWNARLTPAVVREIRARYEQGGATYASLGEEYGIDFGHVGRIVRREMWAHVA